MAASTRRVVVVLAAALALMLGVAAVVVPVVSRSSQAAAGGRWYSLNHWKDPDGHSHLVRWDPCSTVTYAVNIDRAASSRHGRAGALRDVRRAMSRAADRTAITFRYVGATHEVPKDEGSRGWSARQRAAEIVVAWVTPSTSDLLTPVGSGYASGTGGWMWKAWSSGGAWRLAIGRGFVVINAQQRHEYAPGFGAGRTRGALLMHEIGHALGLNHVGNTAELMYPTMLQRSRSSYKVGDKAGLRHVGRVAGCIGVTPDIWPPLPR
jgi:hypothetical protein